LGIPPTHAFATRTRLQHAPPAPDGICGAPRTTGPYGSLCCGTRRTTYGHSTRIPLTYRVVNELARADACTAGGSEHFCAQNIFPCSSYAISTLPFLLLTRYTPPPPPRPTPPHTRTACTTLAPHARIRFAPSSYKQPTCGMIAGRQTRWRRATTAWRFVPIPTCPPPPPQPDTDMASPWPPTPSRLHRPSPPTGATFHTLPPHPHHCLFHWEPGVRWRRVVWPRDSGVQRQFAPPTTSIHTATHSCQVAFVVNIPLRTLHFDIWTYMPGMT